MTGKLSSEPGINLDRVEARPLVRVRESGTPTCRGASTTYANPLLLYARIAPVEGKLGHTLALSPPSRATTVKPSRWARLTQRRRSVRSALSKGDVRRACRGRKVSTQSTFDTDRKSRPSEFSSGIHRRSVSPQAWPQRTSRDRAVTSDQQRALRPQNAGAMNVNEGSWKKEKRRSSVPEP